jgi:Tfp pilus assembly protein PilZ
MLESRTNEKRKDTRISCDVKAWYTSKDNFGREYIKNISLGGTFVETMEIFSIGQEISLSIPFTNNNKYVKVKGQVVRIEKEGIGVKFLWG